MTRRTRTSRARVATFAGALVLGCPGISLAGGGAIVERSRTVASDAAPGDAFGEAVAMKGTTAVVGAPGSDAAGRPDAGAAYVLEERGGVWIEVARLLPSAPVVGGSFGSSVAMTEDTIVVGTRETGLAGGAAYVFERSGAWAQAARIVPPDPESGASFGHDVAIDGDTILIGAPYDDAPSRDSGAAYVYVRAGSGWSLQEKLVLRYSASSIRDAYLGTNVALDGDLALVSYPGRLGLEAFERTGDAWDEGRSISGVGQETALVADAGRFAYGQRVFGRDGAGWKREALVRPVTVGPGDELGVGVALDGDRLLLGARSSDAVAPDAGAVFLFERLGSRWLPSQQWTAGDASAGDRLSVVALDGGRALIGAPGSDATATDAGQAYGAAIAQVTSTLHAVETVDPVEPLARWGDSLASDDARLVVGLKGDGFGAGGRAFVLSREGTSWIHEATLTGAQQDVFGHTVDIDGDHLIVGDPHGPQTVAFEMGELGQVRFFERVGGTWVHRTTVSARWRRGRFGSAVCIDGDTALVGEPRASAVNSPNVYCLVRSGTQWAATSALRPADTGQLDGFGAAVALEGDLAVCGAPSSDVSGAPSGAAFVYERTGSLWTETARLVPSDARDSRFGVALELRGDTLAVGAPANDAQPGAVYVFVRRGGTWSEQARLAVDDPSAKGLGAHLSLRDDRLLVGTLGNGIGYLFVRGGDDWLPSAKLFASDGGQILTTRVALHGETPILATAGSVETFPATTVHPGFCDASDGSLAACPCSNSGVPDAGCDTPGGRGGVRLDVVSRTDTGPRRAVLRASGFPVGSLASGTLLRSRSLASGGAVVFGDGLRCIGLPVTRVGAGQGTGGSLELSVGHAPELGSGTFFYQLHFRSTPAAYCDAASAFNLSSGRAIVWP